MQADTIVPSICNSQALNRYAYAHNSPVRHTDPTGHCIPEECGDAYGDVDEIWTAPAVARVEPETGKAPAIRAPILGNDPLAHAAGIRHTLSWFQLGFECYQGICVPQYSLDQAELAANIYLTLGRGAKTGKAVVNLKIEPSQQTLDDMEVSIIFILKGPFQSKVESKRFVLVGDETFNFYQDPKDMVAGPRFSSSHSVDVKGGLPLEVDFAGAKKPPYEFSGGSTKNVDWFAWPVPQLWP